LHHCALLDFFLAAVTSFSWGCKLCTLCTCFSNDCVIPSNSLKAVATSHLTKIPHLRECSYRRLITLCSCLTMLLRTRYWTVSLNESWGVSGLYEWLLRFQPRPCSLELCYLLDYCRGTVYNCCNTSYAGFEVDRTSVPMTKMRHECKISVEKSDYLNINGVIILNSMWNGLNLFGMDSELLKVCNFSATVTFSRRILLWVRIIDWFFFTSLHICPSSHCILTISLVNAISSNNHFSLLRYVGYENKCQQL
jgi:hypothetical protein